MTIIMIFIDQTDIAHLTNLINLTKFSSLSMNINEQRATSVETSAGKSSQNIHKVSIHLL